MKISGKVIDVLNNEPIPWASIVVTDIFYAPLGPGTVADEKGNFELDSTSLSNPNNLVLVSSEGYEQGIFSPQEANGEIKLKTHYGEREAYTITAKKRVKQLKVNNTWYYVAVGVTLTAFAGYTYYVVK